MLILKWITEPLINNFFAFSVLTITYVVVRVKVINIYIVYRNMVVWLKKKKKNPIQVKKEGNELNH